MEPTTVRVVVSITSPESPTNTYCPSKLWTSHPSLRQSYGQAESEPVKPETSIVARCLGASPAVQTSTCWTGASITYTSVPSGDSEMPCDGDVGRNPVGTTPKFSLAIIAPVVRFATEKPRYFVHVMYARVSSALTVNGRTPVFALGEGPTLTRAPVARAFAIRYRARRPPMSTCPLSQLVLCGCAPPLSVDRTLPSSPLSPSHVEPGAASPVGM